MFFGMWICDYACAPVPGEVDVGLLAHRSVTSHDAQATVQAVELGTLCKSHKHRPCYLFNNKYMCKLLEETGPLANFGSAKSQLTCYNDNQTIRSETVFTKAGNKLMWAMSWLHLSENYSMKLNKGHWKGEAAYCSHFANASNTAMTFSATTILTSKVKGTDGHQAGQRLWVNTSIKIDRPLEDSFVLQGWEIIKWNML